MSLYQVENQWGGDYAPWNQGGMWIIGAREGQNVVALDIQSDDNGETLTGTMTYQGEGPIEFRAVRNGLNNYAVENKWGGSSWQDGGNWIIGFREGQNVVALSIESRDNGRTLAGTMTYQGEGPIGFNAKQADGFQYNVENSWGGSGGHAGGQWIIGCRDNQKVVAINIESSDGGRILTGTMKYEGEGPIGFRAMNMGGNNYQVENQWGGDYAPWHNGGIWVIGYRSGQRVVSMDVESGGSPDSLSGNMTYQAEGPIGFEGQVV